MIDIISIKSEEINDAQMVSEIITLKDTCFNTQSMFLFGEMFILAKYEDKIIGSCGLEIEDNNIHVDSLCVDEDHRNKGIGSRILDNIYIIGKELKCNMIKLEVNKSNRNFKNLKKFYMKNGFEIICKSAGYSNIYFTRLII
jgi:ribosomal protein S18 acetylase RimI-like enzyme